MAADPGFGSGPVGKTNEIYSIISEVELEDGTIEAKECEVVNSHPEFYSKPEESQDMTNESKDDFIEGCTVESLTPGEIKLEMIRYAVIALAIVCTTIYFAGPGIITSFKSCPAAVQIR